MSSYAERSVIGGWWRGSWSIRFFGSLRKRSNDHRFSHSEKKANPLTWFVLVPIAGQDSLLWNQLPPLP